MNKKSIISMLLCAFLLINEGAIAFATINEEVVTNNVVNNEEVKDESETIANLEEDNANEEVSDNKSEVEESYEPTDTSDENINNEDISGENEQLDENTSEIIDENILNNDNETTEQTSEETINEDNEKIESYANDNSTKGTAKEIVLNTRYDFAAEGNYDYIWTKFTLQNDGYITLEVDKVYMGNSSEKSVEIKIEDESGREEYLNTRSISGGDSGSTKNKWTVGLAAGTYYMKLYANFTIPMNQCKIGYKVNFVADNYFENENNDKFEKANYISLN